MRIQSATDLLTGFDPAAAQSDAPSDPDLFTRLLHAPSPDGNDTADGAATPAVQATPAASQAQAPAGKDAAATVAAIAGLAQTTPSALALLQTPKGDDSLTLPTSAAELLATTPAGDTGTALPATVAADPHAAATTDALPAGKQADSAADTGVALTISLTLGSPPQPLPAAADTVDTTDTAAATNVGVATATATTEPVTATAQALSANQPQSADAATQTDAQTAAERAQRALTERRLPGWRPRADDAATAKPASHKSAAHRAALADAADRQPTLSLAADTTTQQAGNMNETAPPAPAADTAAQSAVTTAPQAQTGTPGTATDDGSSSQSNQTTGITPAASADAGLVADSTARASSDTDADPLAASRAGGNRRGSGQPLSGKSLPSASKQADDGDDEVANPGATADATPKQQWLSALQAAPAQATAIDTATPATTGTGASPLPSATTAAPLDNRSTATTTTTGPGTATTANGSPLFTSYQVPGSEGFGTETLHHIRWMKDRDQHSAELQLHPAELGRVSISIDIRDGQASVQLVAQNGEARELLERSLPELRQLLAQNGMTLSDSQVSQQQQQRDSRQYRQLPELFRLQDSTLPDANAGGPARYRQGGGGHRIDHYV